MYREQEQYTSESHVIKPKEVVYMSDTITSNTLIMQPENRNRNTVMIFGEDDLENIAYIQDDGERLD